MALFYISNVMTQQQTCFYQARCLNQLNCIKPEKKLKYWYSGAFILRTVGFPVYLARHSAIHSVHG